MSRLLPLIRAHATCGILAVYDALVHWAYSLLLIYVSTNIRLNLLNALEVPGTDAWKHGELMPIVVLMLVQDTMLFMSY